MKPVKIVSFASRRPPEYREAAERLREAAERFGHPHSIETIDFGDADRKEITLFKPSFILEKLRQDPVRTIWLDVDTTLLAPLRDLPSGDWDVGFCPHHSRSVYSDFMRKLGLKSRLPNSVTGFAVALNPTSAGFHFLKVWKYLCDWPDLASQHDHYRMSFARKLVDIRQVNIAGALVGATSIGKSRANQPLLLARSLPYLSLD